ncbi:hypothetical protein QBC35DRAFT_500262 [Podospora australis]|uniref:Uncharacterized protein n=1 Tax=Podospora australis TaxID=1536484 RepID=A0AAN7AIG1_9PEZI|nr:hypothetical protein QBC35DRAFT_500262 [Podospora australis]
MLLNDDWSLVLCAVVAFTMLQPPPLVHIVLASEILGNSLGSADNIVSVGSWIRIHVRYRCRWRRRRHLMRLVW